MKKWKGTRLCEKIPGDSQKGQDLLAAAKQSRWNQPRKVPLWNQIRKLKVQQGTFCLSYKNGPHRFVR
jgi:hypothetical protein